MRTGLLAAAVLLFAGLTAACSSGYDEEEILADAVVELEKAKTERESYGSTLEAYDKAREEIDLILNEYDTSPIGEALKAGDPVVGGMSLKAFRELGGELEALARAELEPLPNALLVARTVRRAADRDRVLAEIAVEYAETGELEEGAATARTIEGPVDRHWALVWLAANYARQGEEDKAEELFSGARAIVEDSDRAVEKSWMLTEGAGRYAVSGRDDAAVEALEEAIAETERLPENRERAWLMAEIGSKYAMIDRSEKAEEWFARALEAGEQLDSTEERLQALIWFSDRQFDSGEEERALHLMNQAEDMLEAAVSTSDPVEQVGMVIRLAEGYATLGENEQAATLLSKAERATESLGNNYQEAWAMASMGRHYARLGHQDQALELLDGARGRTRHVEGAANRDGLLTDIAIGYAQAGQVGKGLQAAEVILGNYDQAWALTRIAAHQRESGDALDSESLASLQDIAHKHRPLASFWD